MITIQGFLLGCFLVTAIYHLFLYIFYNGDHAALYFSLITFSSTALILVRESNWIYAGKAIMLVFVIVPLFYVEFTRCLYPEEFENKASRYFHTSIRVYISLMTVMVVLLPMEIFGRSMLMMQKAHFPINVLMIVFLLVQLIRASFKKKSDARILLAGFIVLFVTAIIIYMVPENMLTKNNPIGAIGILMLYSIVLARRYSTAYYRSEVLIEEKTQALAEKNETLTHLLNHDALTGAYSRRFIMNMLQGYCEDYLATGKGAVVISFDMDLFKEINDKWGHAMGDEVLVRTVQTLQDTLDDKALLGRVGGEEFMVLLPEADLGDGYSFAEKIRQCVAETTFLTEGHSFNVSCSLGVAVIDEKYHDQESLLRLADRFLYESKSNGRNQVSGPLGA